MTRRLAGRLILPALRWADATGFGHEAASIDAALEVGAGGFIVFGGPAGAVRELTRSLVERAGRALLIGADLERGAGQQFAGLTEIPPPLALASLGDLGVIRSAGARTAGEALSVGVNWVFAPVADLDLLAENPIVQTRSFGAEPAAVAACVRAWIEGCQAAGALACAKHYPGHGRTATDSHAGLPVVSAGADELRQADGHPFAEAIRAGVAAIMTAHVSYPALDPSGRPATVSGAILRELRQGLGFDGAVVTDALIMEGAFVGRSEGEAFAQALGAGVDLLLYPREVRSAHAALVAALDDGTLDGARVDEALARYHAMLERLGPPRAAAADEPGPGEVPARLIERGLLRGSAPALREPIELVVVDDDVGGPYPPSPADWVERELEALGIRLGTGGSRVVLVLAEPRAWKGRGGLGAASQARLAAVVQGAELTVLFAHPRVAAEVPGPAPLLLAWHRQRPLQDAAARWIAGRGSR
jgi:beta-glucosidase-like glycosyl hydrolase